MGIRLLAIGLIAGMAAACTSSHADPKPSPTPTSPVTSKSSASHSATPSPTGPLTTGPNVRPGEKPPVYPELAKQHSANGALAFAGYYFAAYDWGYATNDPTLVAEISAKGCVGCKKYVDAIEGLRKEGGVLTGGRVTVTSRGLRSGKFNYASDYVVRVALDEQPVVVKRPGAAQSTAAAGVHGYVTYVFVSWTSGRWTVVEVASDS